MMANYSDELVEDDYGNLRYIGANPNNYVQFNGELWRIIGVMKDIENADGSKNDKVKLIRSDRLGNYYMDYKTNGMGSSTSEYGSTDWSDSQLMMMLNPKGRVPSNYTIDGGYVKDVNRRAIYQNPGRYWTRSGYAYVPKKVTISEQYYNSNHIDFSSTGLTEEARNMISTSIWNLGGSDSSEKKTSEFYSLERGSKVYSGRPTKWIGEVGLMYASDYGYATSGGSTTDRSTCLNTSLGSWIGSSVSDCKNNNWLYNSKYGQWTLSMKQNTDSVFVIYDTGFVSSLNPASSYNSASPTVYLDSNLKTINNSNGASDSPLTLKVE